MELDLLVAGTAEWRPSQGENLIRWNDCLSTYLQMFSRVVPKLARRRRMRGRIGE